MESVLKTLSDDIETLGKNIDLPLVTRIGTVRRRSARSVPWHCHTCYEAIFSLSGAAAYEFRWHRAIQILGGHFLLVPPLMEHRGVHGVHTPSTICGLQFDPDCCGGWRHTALTKEELHWISRQLATSKPVVCPFGQCLNEALEQLMEAQLGFESNRHSLFVKGRLRLLACSVILGAARELSAPHPPVSNDLVVAAEDYLRRHLAEPVRIPELIKHIGLGHTQLFHLFKSATGVTPNEYLLRLRVEKAKELLARPAPSVTDIALATGFSSSQYFSDVFRKYAGQTPRAYRRESSQRIGA